jgi:hypothetical protein
MNTFRTETPTNKAAINGLAVVGFLTLVAAGMWLAVYSTRFVPTVVNGAGEAAVYLGSIFTSAPAPGLSVVSTPVASTTISFGTASSTASTDATSTPITSTSSKKVATTAGTKTSNTYQIISGIPTTVTPYGLPDLTVSIDAVGYLTTASTDSFVISSTVPYGDYPAAMVTVENIGTNWTGTWRLSASFPTRPAYTYESSPLESLAPGESRDYMLHSDRANIGADQIISITVNFDNAAAESNTNNNTASAVVTILGS